MPYPSIIDVIPWDAAFISAVQAVAIYWVTIACIKLIGVHVVGQNGPQYLGFLLLFTTGMSSGLSHQQAGFWGSIATAFALTATIMVVQRIPWLKNWIHGGQVPIMTNGEINSKALRKTLVERREIEKLAHEYGLPSPDVFQQVILENDGRLTAILNPEYRRELIAKKG